MKITPSIAIYLLCLIYLPIWSQPVSFHNYDEKNGMPQSHATTSFRDSQGFLWIGLTDGLCRFDGKKFKEFRQQPRDSTSLSHNYIKVIAEDKQGIIWVGTKGGLCYFNRETEQFTRVNNSQSIDKQKGNYIINLLIDSQNMVWLCTYEGLFRYDARTGIIIRFNTEEEQPYSLPGGPIWSVFEDSKNRLWVATNQGLAVCQNNDLFQFKSIEFNPDLNGLQTTQVFKCSEQKDGTIWLSTGEFGMYRVIEKGEQFYFQALNDMLAPDSPKGEFFVEDFWITEDDKIWIANWRRGLDEVIFPSGSEEHFRIRNYREDESMSQSLPSNFTQKVQQDEAGILWVATGNGLAKSAPNSKKFETIELENARPSGLKNDLIKVHFQDSRGDYWFGGRYGLYWLSEENFKKRNFDFKVFKSVKTDKTTLSNNDIRTIYEDANEILWVGTRSGLNYLDLKEFPEKTDFQRIGTLEGLSHDWLYDITQIRENEYWIASMDQLMKMTFDPKAPQKLAFQYFTEEDKQEGALVNSMVYQTLRDHQGDYWMGTFGGLSRQFIQDGQEFFESFQANLTDSLAIQDNSITALFLDSRERLWVGTRGGLHLVLRDEHGATNFRNFHESHGLSNKIIQSIEEDKQGNLWIGTNRGLNVFNPDRAIAGEPAVSKVYTFEDGLPGNLCSRRGAFQDKDGNLFFAFGGLTFFHPDSLPENRQAPQLAFTDFKLFSKSIQPSKREASLLKKSINFTKQLSLQHDQNMLTFEFAALDFTTPEKNQYAYKMEGLYDDWINLETQNFVTFTNLLPGSYQLKVKGANSDGFWSEVRQIEVEIAPPFWQTWGAYLMYFVVCFSIIYALYKRRIYLKVKELEQEKQLELARMEERDLLRRKNAADFHDELGHRLTKISLFLALAERNLPPQTNLQEYLGKIKQNAVGLSAGIRDLIWTLDPQKDTLLATLLRLQEFGATLYEHSATIFEMEGIDSHFETIQLSADSRKQILLIFKEAMNNTLKYAEATRAKMSVELKNQQLVISFMDNGKGFDIEKHQKGYGLKNMQNRAKRFDAVLKINSKSGEGTSISLSKTPFKIPLMG